MLLMLHTKVRKTTQILISLSTELLWKSIGIKIHVTFLTKMLLRRYIYSTALPTEQNLIVLAYQKVCLITEGITNKNRRA
jgi:hypothetical protein